MSRIKINEWPRKITAEKVLWHSVSLEAVQPLFSVLFIGIVLGVVLLIAEKLVKYLSDKSSRRRKRNERAVDLRVKMFMQRRKTLSSKKQYGYLN